MSSPGFSLPLQITAAGPIPTPPATLRAILLASVAATNPGYTANLPGSLIEDISSTDVGALALCDSARVETVNSLTPFGANPWLLTELGNIYGVAIGEASNTSVFVEFTGPPGFVVVAGFTVSDGTFQYIVQDGGIIQAGGSTDPLFCVATIQGSWVVPPGTVNQLVTSLPSTVSLTCTNPAAGVPGDLTGETEEDYRSRVLQAGLAASQGMTRYLKTLLAEVAGVQPRLISVRTPGGGLWEVIVGGGDPYDVANAIFQSLFDISTLTGSVITATGITKANPAQVTTDLNHGLIIGQANVRITGATGMTAINNPAPAGAYTVTVVDEKTFTIDGLDSTSFGVYTGNGVITPNNRNIQVDINDYPDNYAIPYVNPPQQSVTMSVTWNTDSPNLVSPAAISQLATPALINYINSIAIGQPINVLEMISVFQAAILPILPTPLLSKLVFVVDINTITTGPTGSTQLIEGDPESYFFATAGGIAIAQG